jgi:hypothetical protein
MGAALGATFAAAGSAVRAHRVLTALILWALALVWGLASGDAAGPAGLMALGIGQVAYPDPIQPQVDVNDYLRVQTQRIGSDTVTWASGTASAPSRSRSRFVLPKVGLASRIYLDIDGGSSTAYDFTAGGGTGAATSQGPWGIVEGISLRVNGGSGWYDVSGFGTSLINRIEGVYPQTPTGTIYTTAPADVESTLYNYDATADSRPRFGLEVPLCLGPSNPLGMILLQNDQTTVELEVRWNTLDAFATLAGGASATLTLTATAILEYFDIPPRDAFLAFFLPMLRWAHWWREERQDVTASGRDANIVSLDNHDTYLRVLHTFIRNGVVNTDNVTDLRFILNRQHTLYDHDDATHLRRQRDAINQDIPAFVWDFFRSGTMRDTIHADAYTDIRSVLDVDSITCTCFLRTATEKLVDLGEPIGGAGASAAVAG